MRWIFDVSANALYVYLTELRPDRQIELGDGIVVDLSADGAPSGVELLNPYPSPALERLIEMGVDRQTVNVIAYLAMRPIAMAPGDVATVPPQAGEASVDDGDPLNRTLQLALS
jgi:uncharacterized protein YuzE